MQDPDVPPQAGGDTNDAVDGVRQNEERVARWAARAKSSRGFLPLPWITATALTWVATTVMAAGPREDLVFRRPTRWSILSLCPLCEKTQFRGFLPLSKTCSF